MRAVYDQSQLTRKNLEALQQSLPKKPAVYTSDHPLTMAEALSKYANQKTVNFFGINVYNYGENGWPVPLYYLATGFRGRMTKGSEGGCSEVK